MRTDELREAYLDFFASKGCVRKPSDVLVPPEDKTVLFTPAGMNQFKREFMGLGDPNFKRATTCQKCIRTGDIENVGRTSFHETFFEMLGNFSFGDYFKREAIHWAWEFLTKVLKLDKDRLTFTVYLDDDEAFDIWNKEIGVSADRITRMGEDDNFWPAGAPTHGPDGVCGPCSEIFYHGVGPKEVEIWNLVFTQFNRVGPNQLEPLPSQNIDTGMGLERAAACLQGVPNVFQTDIFKPIVAAASEILNLPYEADSLNGVRMRRMSDHARALTFCIHENVQPGANNQGYVLRRLLRRAVLDAYRMGKREPFLYKLPPIVAEVMKNPYPEIQDSVPRVQTVIREEEERFLHTLDNGLRLLDNAFRKTRSSGSNVISGKDAFELHSTFGIPVEIVQSLGEENELSVNMDEFRVAEADHAATSRGTTNAAPVFEVGPLDLLKKTHQQGSEFLGYQTTTDQGRIIGIIAKNQLADSVQANGDSKLALVLDRTPFYGESGGQVGDVGVIVGNGFEFQVEDTQRKNDFTLHIGKLVNGQAKSGQSATATVDPIRRQAIRRAHSATHVLHHALHQHLGKHAQQAGSKVEPDRLRFDFSNPEAVGRERLQLIENTVNDLVLRGDAVTWTKMPLEDARALGAMALFGEKYPEIVRVVRMGDYSTELCGGTHLDSVGQVGFFKIIGEESVSAGTRRITALTGKAALDQVHHDQETLSTIAATLKVPASQAADRVATLLEEIKTLKKQAQQRKAESAPASKMSPDDLIASATVINNVKVVTQLAQGMSVDELRQLGDVLKRKAGQGLVFLFGAAIEGKANLIAGVTDDLTKRGLHAGLLLKQIAPVVGGGGGGRPDMATAGGSQPDKLADAIAQGLTFITQKLNG